MTPMDVLTCKGERSRGLKPRTKNFGKLVNAQSRRNGVPKRIVQLVMQYQVLALRSYAKMLLLTYKPIIIW